jgi:two-component system, OmpR family, phosphate regulon sensor histidine kinase PhoR
LLESEGFQPASDIDTLARILSRTASLLQARGCGVFYWDRDKNVLTAMRPFAGLDEAQLQTLEFPVSGSKMGMAVLQDRPVLLDQMDNGHKDTEILREFNIQNAVSVPLALERRDENNDVVDRNIMGVYCAFDKYYGRAFDMEDARLLSMMARQASAVLVTSQLYWKEVERVKQTQAVLESTSVGLMAVSPKGTVTQVNRAARRALGVDKDGWFGRSYNELIGSGDICGLIESALYGSPPEEPRELTLRPPGTADDDEDRIYRVQIDEIQAEDKHSLGWVIVFEDVTDIRRAERMMGVFVDMVSHELRTPLTPIRGFVSTLLQAGEAFDWDTQAEFLQIVDTEAERLGQMIDDLLNIARIQNGRGLQFNFVPTDLKNVVQHVIRLHTQSSHMKGGHTLVEDIPDDFPTFQADDAKLQQILHNLVGNALKYSPNGGEVRISGREVNGGIQITIQDQGLGIPKEQVPKLFGQFFRVDSSQHTGIKGTGLGLWLTKHMVEGHGGRIWVESEYGKGSRFHIWLPKDPNTVLRTSGVG